MFFGVFGQKSRPALPQNSDRAAVALFCAMTVATVSAQAQAPDTSQQPSSNQNPNPTTNPNKQEAPPEAGGPQDTGPYVVPKEKRNRRRRPQKDLRRSRDARLFHPGKRAGGEP